MALTSNKKFLDITGLQALITKIGALRQEYLTKIEAGEAGVTGLETRLDKILLEATSLTGRVGITDGKEILVSIVENLEGLRTELGTKPGSAQPIYDQLTALQTSLTQLQGALDTVEANAFTRVAASYDRTNNKIYVGFGTAEAEPVTEAGSLVANKSFTIDTADFVIDGMLSGVKAVVVETEGDAPGAYEYITSAEGETQKTLAYALDDVPSDKRINGHRYIVFTFKVNETDGEGTPETEAQTPIWVDLVDLHDNFKFAANPTTNDYITLNVTQNHAADGATQVTYTAALGTKANQDFQIVEGTYDSGSGVNRGVLALDTALKAAEADIAELQGQIGTGGEGDSLTDRISTLEDEVRNGWQDEGSTEIPGLLTRASDLEAWTANNAITATSINDYFDYWVMSDEEAAITARQEALEGIKTEFSGAPSLS